MDIYEGDLDMEKNLIYDECMYPLRGETDEAFKKRIDTIMEYRELQMTDEDRENLAYFDAHGSFPIV
jgi:phage terminase large subunit